MLSRNSSCSASTRSISYSAKPSRRRGWAMVLYARRVPLAAMYWAARLLGGRWAAALATLLLVFEPLFSQEARTLQAEMPMLAFNC